MKEVTRVHIAKVPYDIEVEAKKKLEKYIKSLESYTSDADVLSDIEIRMTELLLERGVDRGGIISLDDVAAIRTQLGEPHEFAEDTGDIAVGAEFSDAKRRYYRNKDTAVLGGVLSGIATYFNFNPLWARLAFVVIFISSWGTAALVYIVLWIAVPPAKTATEKLQLAGKPATLASIKELNESEDQFDNKTASRVQNFFRIFFGAGFVFAAVCALLLTVWGAVGILWGTSGNSPIADQVPWGGSALGWVIYSLMVVSGVLLTSLFSLAAYALLAKTWTKRIGVAFIVIVAAGIAASTSSVGLAIYESVQETGRVERSMREQKVALPASFAQVRHITTHAGTVPIGFGDYSELSVTYIVDTGTPRYVLTALPGTKPSIKIEGDAAVISLTAPKENKTTYRHIQPRLTIYGPALESITARQSGVEYVNNGKQDTVSVNVRAGATAAIRGEYQAVTVDSAGLVDLEGAAVTHLAVTTSQSARVRAAVVETLTVNQPKVCAASDMQDEHENTVLVKSVSSGRMVYGGEERVAQTVTNACSALIIGTEDEYYEERGL